MNGDKLRELRKKMKLTRQQLADLSEIPYETLTNWENDRRDMKPYHMRYLELLGKEPKAK